VRERSKFVVTMIQTNEVTCTSSSCWSLKKDCTLQISKSIIKRNP